MLTSRNAGQVRIWEPIERATLVVLVFGMALDRRRPDGEYFPGQPFGFWTSRPKTHVRLRQALR